MKRLIARLVSREVRDLRVRLSAAEAWSWDAAQSLKRAQTHTAVTLAHAAHLGDERDQLAAVATRYRLAYGQAAERARTRRSDLDVARIAIEAQREEIQWLRDRATPRLSDQLRDQADAINTRPPPSVLQSRDRAALNALAAENAELRARLEKHEGVLS